MLVWNAVNIQSYTVFVNNNVLISCTSMTENENKLSMPAEEIIVTVFSITKNARC